MPEETSLEGYTPMKNYISIILVAVLLNLGTASYHRLPVVPPVQNQIPDSQVAELNTIPPPNKVDGKCMKKMNQIPFSSIDSEGKWHYHRAQSVCILYYSQRHVR